MTAKLSRQFYEKLGEDVANELVDWFNQVDATYRADLRELNELNFARFEAKLDQRSAELRTEFHHALGELRSEMQAGFGALRTELHRELATLRTELIKWMFLFWVGTALTVMGLLKF